MPTAAGSLPAEGSAAKGTWAARALSVGFPLHAGAAADGHPYNPNAPSISRSGTAGPVGSITLIP